MGDPDVPDVDELSVAEKIMHALKGDGPIRMRLIRDRIRVVWAAVLCSPKMTAQDAEVISAMRDVDPEVLREIGKQREWRRQRVAICVNLAMNPVTPQDIAVSVLPQLSEADLARVIESDALSSHVRGAAKEVRETRIKPK